MIMVPLLAACASAGLAGATFGAHPAAVTGPCSAAAPAAAWHLR
jgi:hypothetical protein